MGNIKIFPVIIATFFSNGLGWLAYIYRYSFFKEINFVEHLDGLGGALASYATAMMAMIFALIVILTSIDNGNTRKFKAYGYLEASYVFYGICFFQLGLTLLCALLCLSNIHSVFIGSLALALALTTFIQIILIVLQVILLSLKP